MTDPEFRASVRRDALAAGMSSAAANYLAEQVGKKGHKPGPMQHLAMSTTMTAADRLQRICGLYGAEALVPEFKRAGVSLRAVASILASVTDGHRVGAAGIGTVRVRLMQNGMKGAAA